MYSLVSFGHGSLKIYPSNKVQIIQDDSCIVKCSTGRYEATLINTNDSIEQLEETMQAHYTSQSVAQIREIVAMKDFTKMSEDTNILGNETVDFIMLNIDNTLDKNTLLSSTPLNMSIAGETLKINEVCPATLDNCNISNNESCGDVHTTSVERRMLNATFIKETSNIDDKTDCNNNDEGINKIPFEEEIAATDITESMETSSDYEPDPQENSTDTDSDESEDLLENLEKNPKLNKANNSTNDFNLSNSLNVEGMSACNPEYLTVEESRGRKGDKKYYFCVYCHTKQQKLARHLEIKHREETDVGKFISLPKNCKERKDIIAAIRKQGNFVHNTNENYNDGTLIVARRKMQNSEKTAQNYLPCANCKGFYSESTLRLHFAKCTGRNSKKNRIVKVMGKAVAGRIHAQASNTVRKHLFPVLREDEIVRLVRYDILVIIYANKMVEKYKSSNHHFDMIRSRIRLVGRFLKTIKNKEKDITDLASVFYPKYIDSVIESINIEAGLNDARNSYKTPSVAFALTTLLKKIGEILIIECIKNQDQDKKKCVKDFLKVFLLEVAINVNKTAMETQIQQKRRKTVELPPTDDIRRLKTFLMKKMDNAFNALEKSFSIIEWTELVESTLISILTFNRRRPGELERVLIQDFECYQKVDEKTDKDLFYSLSKEKQEAAKKYIKVNLRGKLNRTVSILLNEQHVKAVNCILKFRKNANVSNSNPYVFGSPNKKKLVYTYFRACTLIRKFSVECGAKYPERLRGTILRKHIATQSIVLNLTENEVGDLANFMGHGEAIHKNIYRQPLINREILRMSRLLEKAQGESENSEDSDGEDNAEDSPNEVEATEESKNSSNGVQTPEYHSSNKENKKKKRSTSPYGKVKRRRWSNSEKDIVLRIFGKHISDKMLPSLKQVENVIANNPRLQNRTAPQIKTWIHNQIKIM
ncbi:uncharacterized protein [Prorops nasuta]|uniref:uncharacterized protein n=1 Tax=Prorops nasuta TaxID=863751 RepID=UPI0034CD40D0